MLASCLSVAHASLPPSLASDRHEMGMKGRSRCHAFSSSSQFTRWLATLSHLIQGRSDRDRRERGTTGRDETRPAVTNGEWLVVTVPLIPHRSLHSRSERNEWSMSEWSEDPSSEIIIIYREPGEAPFRARPLRLEWVIRGNRRGPTGTRDRRRDHKEDIISLETAEWRWGTSQSEAVRMWWDFLPRRDKRIEDKGSPTNQGSYAATPIQSSLRLGFHGLLSILWSFPSSF